MRYKCRLCSEQLASNPGENDGKELVMVSLDSGSKNISEALEYLFQIKVRPPPPPPL